ncbi:MAG: MFS transporter [Acidobacteria bacterium]|nr:MFS transporter [Acidobacteriota bacterium]
MQPKWSIAVFLAFAAGINYADRAAVSAVFSLLKRDLGVTDIALGVLGSVFLWGYALSSPAAGLLADRVSRARLVIVSLIGWSVVMACTGFATGVASLIAFRLLLGLVESLYLPAATALLAEHHAPESRGRAMAIHSAGLNLGVIAGGTIAGYLGDVYGWRPGFWILGALGVTMGFVGMRVVVGGPVVRKPVKRAFGPDLVELAGIPSYLILLCKTTLVSFGTWIFLNWLPLYFRETFDMSLAAAGFAGTALLQLSTVAGIGAGGWLSDVAAKRSPRLRMLFQSLCYFAAAPFLLLFLTQVTFAVAAVAITAFSLLRGMGGVNENPTLCDVVPERLRSTAVGFMNLGATAAGGLGVLLAGWLKAHIGMAGVFASITIVMVVAACLLLVGFRWFLERDAARAEG